MYRRIAAITVIVIATATLLISMPATASAQGEILMRKVLLLQIGQHLSAGTIPAESRFDPKGPPPHFVISRTTPWAADLSARTGIALASSDSVTPPTGLITVTEPVVSGTTATAKATWVLKGWFRKDARTKTPSDRRECNFVFNQHDNIWQLTRTVCTVS